MARPRSFVLALIVTCCAVARAEAHDLWLTRSEGVAGARIIVNYGHPGDRPPPAVEKLLDLKTINAGGERSIRDGVARAELDGAPVLQSPEIAEDRPALVVARYDNGFWVETEGGAYRNSSRLVYPGASNSMWSIKFAKLLAQAGAPWEKVIGHELELVPLADPAKLAVGDSLRVRVLFRGKPLPDAEVERGDGITVTPDQELPKCRTDADGVATVPLAKPGPQLLAVDHRVAPSQAPRLAASDLYNATLWFAAAAPRAGPN